MRITAADLIRLCRLNVGLSQEELGLLSGWHRTAVSLWETGKSEPKFDAVVDCIETMGFEIALKRKGTQMEEEITLFDLPKRENSNTIKRNWEGAFQRWCNRHCLDGKDPLGICGEGSMCDWCDDNTYGRPCVRALNAMCREKKLHIDYTDRDFEIIWEGAER